MLIKIGKLRVNVLRSDCAGRDCYSLGFDKGSFTQGRGYTSYHRDSKGKQVEHPVCGTRHHGGCPTNSVCQRCWLASVVEPGGDPCKCGGLRVEPEPWTARVPFLFSVQRRFIEKFRSGDKRVEYRTRKPAVLPGEFHLLYETRGGLGSGRVVAEVRVGKVISGAPGHVWARTSDRGGVNREFFDAYFTYPKGHSLAGQPRPVAYAIEMEPHWLEEPLELPEGMRPPQSWARWSKGRWPLR